MTPWWGMMIRRTPQARITNRGVNPAGEGKAARVAGGAVTHAAIRYRNAARSLSRMRWHAPEPASCSARPPLGILPAEMAALLGGNPPAGFTHPTRANPLDGGVPGLQALRFRPEPRKPAPHPGRRDPEAAERLRATLTLATASSHTALQAHRLRAAATARDRE